MSYILDALKKADSQRDRAAVPGIGTQQVIQPAETGGARGRPLVWAGSAALAAVAAAVVWRIATPPAPPVIVVQSPAPLPAPSPVPPPAPPLPVPAPVAAPAPAPAAAPPAVSTPAPAARPSAASPEPSPSARTKSRKPKEEARAERIVPIAELPPDLRREIPALAITGSTYSENPAHRMLIINGQVVNEGGTAAPGLVLEEIRPGSAVLLFRGTRFSMAY